MYLHNMKYPTNYQQHGVNTSGGNKNNEFARKYIRFWLVQTVNSMPSSITNKIQTHSISKLLRLHEFYVTVALNARTIFSDNL